MRLGCFSDHAFERLFAEVDKNSGLYAGDYGWLDDYFAGAGDYYQLSSVNVTAFKPSQFRIV